MTQPNNIIPRSQNYTQGKGGGAKWNKEKAKPANSINFKSALGNWEANGWRYFCMK